MRTSKKFNYCFEPILVRQGMEAKAATVWATDSRSHFNREFTFGSQALAVTFTEQETVGGRVWPNVIFNDRRFDYAFAIWSNSTLGLLSHWWCASRQQSSKAGMVIRSADSRGDPATLDRDGNRREMPDIRNQTWLFPSQLPRHRWLHRAVGNLSAATASLR